jgi:hypothetical protein
MTREEFIQALEDWRELPGNAWCVRSDLIAEAARLHAAETAKLQASIADLTKCAWCEISLVGIVRYCPSHR